VDPVEFANQYLAPAEAQSLVERVAEEQALALKAMRSGQIQGLGDLFRITARSIGPVAGIRALGNAYRELTTAQQQVVVGLLAEAVRSGAVPEAAAGLAAMAKNFRAFGPADRAGCLAAMAELAARDDAEPISRERVLRLLNVLYPNLDDRERDDVRRTFAAVRQHGESPAVAEFFNETIPQVERQAKP
jgi:hypothetical protein